MPSFLNLKERIVHFLLYVSVFCFFCISTMAFRSHRYTIPDNRFVMSVSTSQLGEIDILIPYGNRNRFSLRGNQPVNITSATVNGYFNRGGSEYTVRWTIFGTAEYRLTTGNNTWNTLTITSVNPGTTIQFLSELDTSQLNDSTILNLLFLGIRVFICYLLLRRN